MILLCKKNSFNTEIKERVIQLRPIPIEKSDNNLSNEMTKEQYLNSVQKQIEEVEEDLTQLEKEYDEKKNKLEKQIEQEKLAWEKEKEEKKNKQEKQIEQEKLAWEKEKEQLMQQAREQGFKAGFSEGKKQSLEKYKEQIQHINQLAELAEKDYQKTVEESTDTILQLSIHVAEKILDQALVDDPSLFKSVVNSALASINSHEEIAVYVHPNYYELLHQRKNELQQSVHGQATIKIYIDHDLDEKSCKIEHPFGQIDASIDTQLKEIHKILKNVNNGE